MAKRKYLLIIAASVPGLAVTALVLTGTVKIYEFPSRSMTPTVLPGDHVIATRCFRPAGTVARGDLVVFDSARADPRLSGSKFLQRVVALEGDTVEIIDGRLHVNGSPLPDRGGKPPTPADPRAVGWSLARYPLVIPQGEIFTLGDNHANSLDSRYFGPFPVDAVTHRPHHVILPLSRMRKLE